MPHGSKRRTFLKGIGAAAILGAVGTRTTSATPAEDRFIVDAETVSMDEMSGMEVVYDFTDYISYVVVEGDEEAMPSSATYAPDIDIEIDVPQQETMEMDARDAEDPFYGLQWDKQEQDIETVHEEQDATGDGARIGIIDDGVLGAGDRDIVGGLEGHPDLPNVRGDLSVNFTDDGNGPGPLNDDHGTHCAGTAAAAANGVGVVGVAPEAEIVDLRVFSGLTASFADVVGAVIVGAVPEGVPVNLGTEENPQVFTGAGCDVLNLSLGSPPLVPIEVEDTDGDGELTDELPELPNPYVPVPARQLPPLVGFVSAGGTFAVEQGTLPVASAGNDGINIDEAIEIPDGEGISTDSAAPTTLPAEADGYMSIGAAGPIGFGWPGGQNPDTVAGLEISRAPRVELPTEEPAFYTNYGAEGVDVTAGGGNADIDAIGAGPNWFFDLVFSTGIANLLPQDPDGDGEVENPEDIVLDEYVPGYVFKAGTSFSAPNVAGLAALLYAVGDNPTPQEVRETIEETARPLAVGKGGETTAPGAEVNVATDGEFDGDKPSNPGSAPGPFDSETYRGEGHIDVSRAVARLSEDDEDDEEEEDEGEDDEGRGNGRGRGN